MKTRSSLQIQAYNYIKDKILSSELDFNTLYSETKLAAEIGISRTPMREALQCLSQDGYITIIPSKGFMIKSLSEKDMIETIQVRCAIEGFCTHIITNEINTDKGKELLENLEKILECQKKSKNLNDSFKEFMKYDHEFHLLIINYVNNQEFNQIFQRLMYLIQLTTQSALSVNNRIEGTLSEHEQYFNCLKEGRKDKAYNLIINHLMMPVNMHIAESKI